MLTIASSAVMACSSAEPDPASPPPDAGGAPADDGGDGADRPGDTSTRDDGGSRDDAGDSAADAGEQPLPTAMCASTLSYVGSSNPADQTLSVENGKLVVRAQSTRTCLATLEQAARTGDFETTLRIEGFTAGRYGHVLAALTATNGGAGVMLFQDGTNAMTVTASSQGYGQCPPKSIPSPTLPLSVRLARTGKMLTAQVSDAAGKVATSACEIASLAAASEPVSASLSTLNSDSEPTLVATLDDWITTGDKACTEDFSAKRF